MKITGHFNLNYFFIFFIFSLFILKVLYKHEGHGQDKHLSVKDITLIYKDTQRHFANGAEPTRELHGNTHRLLFIFLGFLRTKHIRFRLI